VNIKRAKSSNVKDLFINNQLVSDPVHIANFLNNYFTNVASKIVADIEPTDRPPDGNIQFNENVISFSKNPITFSEIKEACDQLQSKTSPDFEGISLYFVKKVIYAIATPILHVFRQSLCTGIVPSQFKIAKVVPVFKSGDKTNPDNYRPISLLSSFSKILEKVVSIRLTNFLENEKILTTFQFGFRSSHSTAHAMVHFLNNISKALNEKKHIIAIFCDLRKAFDTVDHDILLKKLYKMGIRGIELDWFKDYLNNRKQFVFLDGKSSSLLNILTGVPQGSILGPLLFLLYINDLPLCSDLMSILFADDTTLSAAGDDLTNLTDFVNTEFQKVCEFFRSNRLSLHPEKTKFMIFTSNTNVRNQNISIFCNNNNIVNVNQNLSLVFPIQQIGQNDETSTIRFLGVLFDTNLNFKIHVKSIMTKISKGIFALRTAKNILNQKSLKLLYYSLVHCYLIYGIQVWSSAPNYILNELFKKQKIAIRLISNAKYNAHTEPLFKTLDILPFPSLILYFQLQFMQHFQQKFLPNIFSDTWIYNNVREIGENAIVLRNNDQLRVPFARISLVEKLPLISLPTIWENFPDENIKFIRNKAEFNEKLKTYLLKQLSYIINCTRLYCPSCSV
jgi:hypothetical protein